MRFEVLGQCAQLDCFDRGLHEVLVANFGGMGFARDSVRTDINYSVAHDSSSQSILVSRNNQSPVNAEDTGTLVYLLEKDLTVELQTRRPDLLFLHAAVVELRGKVFLIAADSGVGKSTTTWGLLHHQFHYLSDELSPIDVENMRVFPYPHALCLKAPPPNYPLPEQAIDLGRTLHVPTSVMPSPTVQAPRPLGAVFLLTRPKGLEAPTVRPLSAAEASARLYINALNALAHDNRGLDSVARIAEEVPCFLLEAADLPLSCTLIRTVAERVIGNYASAISC